MPRINEARTALSMAAPVHLQPSAKPESLLNQMIFNAPKHFGHKQLGSNLLQSQRPLKLFPLLQGRPFTAEPARQSFDNTF